MAATEWTLRIKGWIPASDNKLAGRAHWAKKRDIKDADYRALYSAAMLSGMPAADGRRKVAIHVVYPEGRRRFDHSNLKKSCFDGMKRAGIIKDDSPTWLEDEGVTDSRNDTATEPVTYVTVSEA